MVPNSNANPNNAFTGWQNPTDDYESRREMIHNIVQLLRNRKPDAPEQWLQKLPEMARRLEDKLYRYALNKQEYKNPNTLTKRLQSIAKEMKENKIQPPNGYPPNAVHNRIPTHATRGPAAAVGHMTGSAPVSRQNSMTMPHQQPPQMHQNNMMNHQPPQQPQPPYNRTQPPPQQPPPQQSAQPGGERATAFQKEQVLRQQQQRLLLLRHASKCPAPAGQCRATSHCAQMKRLWRHIAKCKDQQCHVPHCVSSRYVLSHYHRCQDSSCAVCGPVREAITRHQDNRKSNNLRRDMPPQGRSNVPPTNPPPNMQKPQQPPPNQQPPPQQGSQHQLNRPPLNPDDPNYHKQMMIQQQLQKIEEQEKQFQKQEEERRRKQAELLERKRRLLAASQGGGQFDVGMGTMGQPTSNMVPGGHQQMGSTNPNTIPAGMNGVMMNDTSGMMGQADHGVAGGRATPKTAPKGKATKGKQTKQQLAKAAAAEKAAAAMKNNKLSKAQVTKSMSSASLKRTNSQASVHEPAKKRMATGANPNAPPRGYPPQTGAPGYPPRGPAGAAPGHPGRPAVAPRNGRANVGYRDSSHVAALSSTTSLINTFSRAEIEQHIQSLAEHNIQARSADLKTKALTVLRKLLNQQFAWVFNKPVDPKQLNIPDYFDVIKHPMDLGTVKKKLEGNQYSSLSAFANDVRLTFNNAVLYNTEGSEVNMVAKEYGLIFEKEYNELLEQSMQEEALKRTNENACRLCGEEKLSFDPAVYYCSGKCGAKIRRNATYYATPDHKMFWCQPCYNTCLKDTVTTDEGAKFKKSDLVKRKNAEIVNESWVQCDRCNRWFHQICALFNGKKNEQSKKDDPYFCPFCVIRYIDSIKSDRIPETLQPARHRYTARDLPSTDFSKYLEYRVQNRILKERKIAARNKKLSLDDIDAPGDLTIRVVSCKDTKMQTRSNLDKHYKGKPFYYPRTYPYRLKCVLVFEKLQGVDVLIFGMYLQSYGSDCPQPNHRSLYIAYLDSVFYFEPRFIRTPVYQELLIATLDYEKRRGFTKAFIWACPPIVGDDYILYCHPKEQRTPKSDMLRKWYLKLLEDARKEGVVICLDNLHDAYFAQFPNALAIPNFEGDYWPGVTEQVIEQLEADKVNPKTIIPKRVYSSSRRARNSDKLNKKGAHKQKKSKKHKYHKKSIGSASALNDGEPVNERCAPPPLPMTEEPQHDAVTEKIAEVIEPMKEDFIVVYMHYICVECNLHLDQPDMPYWLPKDFDPKKEEQDHMERRYAPPYCLCHNCYVNAHQEVYGKAPEKELPKPCSADQKVFPISPNILAKTPTHAKSGKPDSKDDVKSEKPSTPANGVVKKEGKTSPAPKLKPKPKFPPVKPEDVGTTADRNIKYGGATAYMEATCKAVEIANAAKEKKFARTIKEEQRTDTKSDGTDSKSEAANAPRSADGVVTLQVGKRAIPKNPYKSAPCELKDMVPYRAMIRLTTDDVDDPVDCEFFDTRQQFLSLCQGNRYQFDQLRRAKHSSMMVLYHLHNPDLPSYTHTCNHCRQDIVSDIRYTCTKCNDYDLCESCKVIANHPHQLRQVDAKAAKNEATNARRVREKRKRSIKLHMQLLVHASSCKSSAGQCNSQNCPKMKSLLKHGATCKLRVNGGCKTCQRIWALLQIHARQCNREAGTCPVPRCADLKEHIRKSTQMQQDRRIRAHRRMQEERRNAVPTPNAAAAVAAASPHHGPGSATMDKFKLQQQRIAQHRGMPGGHPADMNSGHMGKSHSMANGASKPMMKRE